LEPDRRIVRPRGAYTPKLSPNIVPTIHWVVEWASLIDTWTQADDRSFFFGRELPCSLRPQLPIRGPTHLDDAIGGTSSTYSTTHTEAVLDYIAQTLESFQMLLSAPGLTEAMLKDFDEQPVV
jgi:hypothetical protein